MSLPVALLTGSGRRQMQEIGRRLPGMKRALPEVIIRPGANHGWQGK